MLKVGGRIARLGHWPEELDAYEVFKGLESWPSAKVLAAWRAEVPEGRDFVTAAPEWLWRAGANGLTAPFEPLETALDLFERVLAAQTVLESDTVVFYPPAEFTPSTGNRARLEAFLRKLAHRVEHLVFVPSGLWEEDHLASLLEQGLVHLALDARSARHQAGNIDWGYLRVTGLGRVHLGPEDLYDVAEACHLFAAGYCIFDLGRDRANVAAARRLRGLLEESDHVPDRQ